MDSIKKIHTIAYLLSKFGAEGTNSIKLIKLLVIADVYKLRKYGSELLYQEEYLALPNGPVPSTTTNLVEHLNNHLSEQELTMSKKMWKRVSEGNGTWDVVRPIGNADEQYLAEADKEALDYAYEEYGAYTPEKLIDMVHEYAAWKKHKQNLDKREKIEKTDFFENDNGPAKTEKEDLQSSKEYFLQTY